MTLSWAGTIISATFENATSIDLQLEALPASAARLNYNRFRAELDGEEVGEFGTTPGRHACRLLGPACCCAIAAQGCMSYWWLGNTANCPHFSNCRRADRSHMEL